MQIYKIFRAGELAAFEAKGRTAGAPVDVADGYIHFSTAAQAAETLRRHFAGETGLFLLAVDADAAGDRLKWEPARGGDLFAHLYRDLERGDILWTRPIADGPDGPVLPDGTV